MAVSAINLRAFSNLQADPTRHQANQFAFAKILQAFVNYLYSDAFPKHDQQHFRSLAKRGLLQASITPDTVTGQAIVKLGPGQTWHSYFYDGRTFAPVGSNSHFMQSDVWNYPDAKRRLNILQTYTDNDLQRDHEQEEASERDYGHSAHIAPVVEKPFNLAEARKKLNNEIEKLRAEVKRLEEKILAPEIFKVPAK